MTEQKMPKFSHWVWFHDDAIAAVIHILLVVALIVVAVLLWGGVYPAPEQELLLTRHQLPYLPKQYIVLEELTNVVEDDGVGVGLPQGEYMSLEEFTEAEQSGSVYYLDISLHHEDSGLHYYDLQPGKVMHYFHRVERVISFWLGIPVWYYNPVGGYIEEGALFLLREPVIGFFGVFVSLVLCILMIVLYVLFVAEPLRTRVLDPLFFDIHHNRYVEWQRRNQ